MRSYKKKSRTKYLIRDRDNKQCLFTVTTDTRGVNKGFKDNGSNIFYRLTGTLLGEHIDKKFSTKSAFRNFLDDIQIEEDLRRLELYNEIIKELREGLESKIKTRFIHKHKSVAPKRKDPQKQERNYKVGESVKRDCFVYVMKDESLPGWYKIGKSVNPKHREGTLKAEKPSIKMVFYAPETKKINEALLHNQYAEYRGRGEWFNLTDAQLRYICYRGGKTGSVIFSP